MEEILKFKNILAQKIDCFYCFKTNAFDLLIIKSIWDEIYWDYLKPHRTICPVNTDFIDESGVFRNAYSYKVMYDQTVFTVIYDTFIRKRIIEYYMSLFDLDSGFVMTTFEPVDNYTFLIRTVNHYEPSKNLTYVLSQAFERINVFIETPPLVYANMDDFEVLMKLHLDYVKQKIDLSLYEIIEQFLENHKTDIYSIQSFCNNQGNLHYWIEYKGKLYHDLTNFAYYYIEAPVKWFSPLFDYAETICMALAECKNLSQMYQLWDWIKKQVGHTEIWPFILLFILLSGESNNLIRSIIKQDFLNCARSYYV